MPLGLLVVRPVPRLVGIGGQRQIWAAARKARWSKFDSEQYESVIDGIRATMGEEPLWHIERYWRGYQ